MRPSATPWSVAVRVAAVIMAVRAAAVHTARVRTAAGIPRWSRHPASAKASQCGRDGIDGIGGVVGHENNLHAT